MGTWEVHLNGHQRGDYREDNEGASKAKHLGTGQRNVERRRKSYED